MADIITERVVFDEHSFPHAIVDGDEEDESPPSSSGQKEEEKAIAKTEREGELEEQSVAGQIIQGEDGEYYVVMDDDGNDDDVELDNLNNVSVVDNEDGTQTLVLESNVVDPAEAGSRQKKSQRGRAVMASTENGTFELIELLGDEEEHDDDDGRISVGAMQTAETAEEGLLHSHLLIEPIPQGMKLRRNRVYGTCRCGECGQSFVNTARLERHLAVHQVFGSYLCPLCGKTYKYEYNLFYHWRRTCRDLNDLMSLDDRKNMDVNALRQLVDEVAQKKAEYGPIEIGISRSVLFQSGPLARLEMPANPLGRRGTTCRACGVIVHSAHMARHMALHKGLATVGDRSVVGGFYCDLCGLMFRQHFNLIKHWRSNCAEIQANLPDDVELTLDDQQLKAMVLDLLKRATVNDDVIDTDSHASKHHQKEMYPGEKRRIMQGENVDVVGGELEMGEDEDPEAFQERWVDEQGAVFADDFDDEEMVVREDGLVARRGSSANREKWSLNNNGPIQCTECFRTFANSGRLERHMAGFHASYGSHHCALCGNRFKYDYNLLYHYRKSCPYTKAYIDRDVREQMDAVSLRKLVRSLAQKDVRLTPQVNPSQRAAKAAGAPPSNDCIVRREMMKPMLTQPPPHLLTARPGLGNAAKSCPICSVIFYSLNAIERHMRFTHNVEYVHTQDFDAEPQHEVMDTEAESYMVERDGREVRRAVTEKEEMTGAGLEDEEDMEPPPLLEPQAPGEQPPVSMRTPHRGTQIATTAVVEEEEVGLEGGEEEATRFVDEDGEELDAEEMRRVARMIETGEITVQHGETIILMDEFEKAYEGGELDGEMRLIAEEEVEGDEAEREETSRRPAQRGRYPHQQVQVVELSEMGGVVEGAGVRGGKLAGPSSSHTHRGGHAPSNRKRRPSAGRGGEERSIWDDDDLEEEEETQRRGQTVRGTASAWKSRRM